MTGPEPHAMAGMGGSAERPLAVATEAQVSVPLCVDLDGTLTPVDTLHHLLGRLAVSRPLACWDLPWWALRGRSQLKAVVSDRIAISPTRLQLRAAVMEYIREQKAAGRTIVLATAADHRIAQAVADHLGVFGMVLATRTGDNLKGQRKLEIIRSKVGSTFDYMGDSMADIPLFRAARHSILVAPSRRLQARVHGLRIPYSVIRD
jgi:hypothetical protein